MNKNITKNKFIAVFIGMILAVNLLPLNVLANDESVSEETTSEQTTSEQTVKTDSEDTTSGNNGSSNESKTIDNQNQDAESTSEDKANESADKSSSEKAKDEEIKIAFEIEKQDGDDFATVYEKKSITINKDSKLSDLLDKISDEKDFEFAYENAEAKDKIKFIKNLKTGKIISLDESSEYEWIVEINQIKYTGSVSDKILKDDDKVTLKCVDIAKSKSTGYSVESIDVDSDADQAYSSSKDAITKALDSSISISEETGRSIVFNLSRGEDLSLKYANNYIAALTKALTKTKSAKLDKDDAMDNACAVLTLTALGKDPRNFKGYNLLKPLTDVKYVCKGGTETIAMALIAINSNNKFSVSDKVKNQLIEEICKRQNSDGSWNSAKGNPDFAVTSAAVQALSKYKDNSQAAVDALQVASEWIASKQKTDGGFAVSGTSNVTDTSNAIKALTSINIDVKTNPIFNKSGVNPISALQSMSGSAKNSSAYSAIVAYSRFISGKATLYDLNESDLMPVLEDSKAITTEKALAAAGVTKSISLGLEDLSEEANKVADSAKEINQLNLGADATKYSSEDIEKITEAYKAYMELSLAEQLAMDQNDDWKTFMKLTEAISKMYHSDTSKKIDLRDNDDEALPWYIKLVVTETELSSDQAENATGILGEGSQIELAYDIKLVNTLTGEEWEPEKIINVRLALPEALAPDNAVLMHVSDEGKIQFISYDLTDDKENIKFNATEFSVYAIASAAENSGVLTSEKQAPNSILPWCIGGAIALALIVALIIARRKLT